MKLLYRTRHKGSTKGWGEWHEWSDAKQFQELTDAIVFIIKTGGGVMTFAWEVNWVYQLKEDK